MSGSSTATRSGDDSTPSASPQLSGRGAAVAVVPVRSGQISHGGEEAAAEAVDLGGLVMLVGSGTADAAAEFGIGGDVICAELGDVMPGRWSRQLAGFLRETDVVIFPASPDGRDLAPRLAAELDRPLLAGAIAVRSNRAVVGAYGGLVQRTATVESGFVATLEPGVRSVVAGSPSSVSHVELPAPGERRADGPADAELIEILPPDAATMDLSEARRVVGAGAGLMSGTDDEVRARFERLVTVGAAMGASMGATRVVTDAGWVDHARQIGTTGVVIDPRLYLAFAISGAVQHTAGLGRPDHVVSVNTDPHCPMMAMADLAVVADANAVLDELAVLLGSREPTSSGTAKGDPVQGQRESVSGG